jgi:flagellar hook protein FlgE
MQDPFITAVNSQKAAMGWYQTVSENMGNVYTAGYREIQTTFSDFMNGTMLQELPRKDDQGKSHPGKNPSNLFIEGKGMFAVRKPDGTLLFTRLGDFKFDADGTMVNDKGYKVQAYLLGEDGKVIDTGESEKSPQTGNTGANNPNHGQGGPGHIPTTEVNLWVDPTNGKFFGKYDEYKVRSDGTVVGVADKGKTVVPLYKIALVNFVNPSGLATPEDQMFVPTTLSGEPVAVEAEIRSGLVERSNVDTREQVMYLQQAKAMMDITSKLIGTNKALFEETLRLIQ